MVPIHYSWHALFLSKDIHKIALHGFVEIEKIEKIGKNGESMKSYPSSIFVSTIG